MIGDKEVPHFHVVNKVLTERAGLWLVQVPSPEKGWQKG